MSAAIRLRWRAIGNGPPLLLIHGLGADHRDWRDVAPELAERHRVLLPDLRGHGSSPRAGGMSPWQMARDILALMDAEGITAAPVAGHSMGGAVALSLALLAPERVSALIIVNSVPSFRPRRLSEWVEILARLAITAILGPRRLGALMAHRLFPGTEQAGQRALIVGRAARNSRRVYLASLLRLTRWSVRDRLGEIAAPTLVIAAEHDYFPVADVRAFADALPRARFVLAEGAGHGLPLARGIWLADRLLAFLADMTRT